MSDISIFTAVKYNNNLENPPVKGWCAKQLDNWTFPLFGSKIEIIQFDKDNASDLKIARYQENTTKPKILVVAFHILLLVTVIFPLIVLISRAIIRHNIAFKKIEPPNVLPTPPLKTTSKTNQCNIRLLEGDTGKEIRVPVGKPFSIELWHSVTTGHNPWKISQIPSFINYLDQCINYLNHPPGTCGGGNDYVFIFEPKSAGRGDIVMQLPCLGLDDSRNVEKKFTFIAE